MLFTPSYHADTDTAKGGLEWVVNGQPPRVVSGPHRDGKTPIPPNGFVLSFGGAKPSGPLATIRRGTRVTLTVVLRSVEGEPESWPSAQDIVGGAGLLVRNGRYLDDWTMEAFAKGFPRLRHPRTMIGTSKDGAIWLIAVDGRQPQTSIGMTFAELQGLARRLDLVNALNLDGGGSTTMWVQGSVVNSPSDAAGAAQGQRRAARLRESGASVLERACRDLPLRSLHARSGGLPPAARRRGRPALAEDHRSAAVSRRAGSRRSSRKRISSRRCGPMLR